jgi:glycosyltransferase involved in cell wall biosynthesis
MQHGSVLQRLTRGGRIPYVVLCLYNDERSVTTQALRERGARFFRGASRVVFVAEQNLRLASRQLAIPLPNAIVVQNPVNLADTSAVPWPAPTASGARLACVARLSVRHKGHDALLEALAAPVWRDRPWELRLYGRGPDERYVRHLVAHFGLEGRVHLRGHVGDVRSIWTDNELAVIASYGEGTPLALVEAMLSGRPAVVTDVGGNVEWVQDGVTGFVAAGATSGSIGDALERAWRSRDAWRVMGEAARTAALARHDPSPGRTLLGLLEDAARGGAGATVARSAGPRGDAWDAS